MRNIFIIKEGIIQVEVPLKDKLIHFAYLTPGSCFGAFSPFGEDTQQILNFKAKTNIVLYSIDVEKDLESLAKTDKKLYMLIKTFRLEA